MSPLRRTGGAEIDTGAARMSGSGARGRDLGELIGSRLEARGPAPVSAPGPGPLVRVVAVLVDVPVGAAGVPDGCAQRCAQLALEPLGRGAPDLDPARVTA